ncbi:MAG: CHAT domain-containing protein [Sphingomonadales bacterium]|nr:CHAT domain-containing protein [Sphingomonadales bacterium]
MWTNKSLICKLSVYLFLIIAPEISLGMFYYALDSSRIKIDSSEKNLWIDRVEYYETINNNDSVEICLRLAIKSFSNSTDPASIKVGELWYRLGELYQTKLQRFEDALYCYDSVIKLSRFNRWELEDFFWRAQWNMGAVFAEPLGNWESAKMAYEDARKSVRRIEGPTSRRYCILTGSIALCYSKLGYFREAEELYEEAIKVSMRIDYASKKDQFGAILLNFGEMYYRFGDLKKSEHFTKEALMVYRELPDLHDKKIDGLFKATKNLGNTYKDQELFLLALNCYQKCFEWANALPNDKLQKTLLYNNIATVYIQNGDFDNAQLYLDSAFTYFHDTPNSGADYGILIYNKARVFHLQGKYSLAENFYQEARRIRQQLYQPKHPDFIAVEGQLADILIHSNRISAAYEVYDRLLSDKFREISDNFEWLDETQQDAYWKSESSFYDDVTWNAQRCYENYPAFSGLAYNISLQSKSRLMESKISIEDYFQEIENLRDSLKIYKRKLNKLETEPNVDPVKFQYISDRTIKLDKELLRKSSAYERQKEHLMVTWKDVKGSLKAGEMAIEFIRSKNRLDSNFYYHALVVTPDSEFPIWVTLCNEAALLGLRPEYDYTQYYDLIWAPLSKVLPDVHTIYYSPIGVLSNIPFHALYPFSGKPIFGMDTRPKRGRVQKSSYLLANHNSAYLLDHLEMNQLTSTRYLAIDKDQMDLPIDHKNIFLCGGIDYDFDNSPQGKFQTVPKILELGSSNIKPLQFLKGTLDEVHAVRDSLNKQGWSIQINESSEASESYFKSLDGNQAKTIVHLATHGFSFSEPVSTLPGMPVYQTHRNPLMRTGLIMAGGNSAWLGQRSEDLDLEQEDGILTALEVSQLKLRKTRLVVLSACQTGLGSIQGSEGTFGLKRAFKIAGVQQLLVSLWDVPDQETRELMGYFYSNLSTSLVPSVAFLKAQRSMREKYPTRPDLWAAFVLIR